MNLSLLHTPDGVRDFYGKELDNKNQIMEKFEETIKLYGYDEIQTPTLEFLNVFAEDEDYLYQTKTFRFIDRDGETLVLRPDYTPSVARCAVKYFSDENVPLRFFYKGNAFSNKGIYEGKAIEVSYQASWSDKPHTYCMHPYCLKLFKQRWYVIARRDEFDNPYVYALDERMKDIKILNKKLDIPKDFDAKELYKDYYGVIMDDVDPEKVKIKVDADQVHYYESLPLHETQTVIEKNDEYSIFEYFLAPNYDFMHELLSKGESVEVIEPKWFRDDIKRTIKSMLNRYKK